MDERLITDELEAIYEKRIQGYDNLIMLAEEQQSILLADRHKELNDNIAKFDPLLMDLQRLDKRETAFTERIEQVQTEGKLPLNFDLDTLRLRFKKELAKRVERLRGLVEANTRLLNNLMSFANFTMDAICRVATGQSDAISRNNSILLDLKV